VKANLPTAIWTNWCIWPFVTFINLSYVPIIYRVLVVNFVSIFWNFYLANLNQRKSLEADLIKFADDNEKYLQEGHANDLKTIGIEWEEGGKSLIEGLGKFVEEQETDLVKSAADQEKK
jgi:predicted glycosyl hydrolase (DUF1957 family)